jgi:hypothetical protein
MNNVVRQNFHLAVDSLAGDDLRYVINSVIAYVSEERPPRMGRESSSVDRSLRVTVPRENDIHWISHDSNRQGPHGQNGEQSALDHISALSEAGILGVASSSRKRPAANISSSSSTVSASLSAEANAQPAALKAIATDAQLSIAHANKRRAEEITINVLQGVFDRAAEGKEDVPTEQLLILRKRYVDLLLQMTAYEN